MESTSGRIIRFAWARVLGLADDALAGPSAGVVIRESDSVAMYVRLWDQRVLVGPSHVLELTPAIEAGASDLRIAAMLVDAMPAAGRFLGQAALAFTDSYVGGLDATTCVITGDRAAVVEVEADCSSDEVVEAGLAAMHHAVVALDEADRPAAAAGYEEWQQIIAHLGVLTAPQLRGRGFGAIAAATATNDALDAGLVPQWRARIENDASRKLAARLGFSEVGTQITVLLPEAI